MNTLLLRPRDVLHLGEGRPMEGALTGTTRRWPMPQAICAALLGPLQRVGGEVLETHRFRDNGGRESGAFKKLGSLVSVGPFPVKHVGGGAAWFFPRPLDAQLRGSVATSLRPVIDSALGGEDAMAGRNSLPTPLKFVVANRERSDEDDEPEPWVNTAAYNAYLNGESNPRDFKYLLWKEIVGVENRIGIGIDSETGVAGQGKAEGQFYTSQYLRLKDDICLGAFSKTKERVAGKSGKHMDLIPAWLKEGRCTVGFGGQQRVCEVELVEGLKALPLPAGLTTGFPYHEKNGFAVKWTLLSPSIWVETDSGVSLRYHDRERTEHGGGWLPNWVDPTTGEVLLRSVPPDVRSRRRRKNSRGLGYDSKEGTKPLRARLVAAAVGKPEIVTGFALRGTGISDHGGPKPVHRAVPAGSVYYFYANTPADATALAEALNWNGAGDGNEVLHRRSMLLGEKGYGLGVCSSWQAF